MGSMSTELRSQHLSQHLSISAVSIILPFMILVFLSMISFRIICFGAPHVAHTLMDSRSTELGSQHLFQHLSVSTVSRILPFMVLVILSWNFFTTLRHVKQSIVVKVMKFSSQHQTEHAESFSSKTNNRNVRYPDLMWDCQKWCQMVRSTHNDGQQVHRTYISALVSASQQFP